MVSAAVWGRGEVGERLPQAFNAELMDDVESLALTRGGAVDFDHRMAAFHGDANLGLLTGRFCQENNPTLTKPNPSMVEAAGIEPASLAN